MTGGFKAGAEVRSGCDDCGDSCTGTGLRLLGDVDESPAVPPARTHTRSTHGGPNAPHPPPSRTWRTPVDAPNRHVLHILRSVQVAQISSMGPSAPAADTVSVIWTVRCPCRPNRTLCPRGRKRGHRRLRRTAVAPHAAQHRCHQRHNLTPRSDRRKPVRHRLNGRARGLVSSSHFASMVPISPALVRQPWNGRK